MHPRLFFLFLVLCAAHLAWAAPKDAPTLEQAGNAKVTGLEEVTGVKLSNGLYQGPPYDPGGASRPEVKMLRRMTATGNVDGKAGDERLVFLTVSTGGTGEPLYMAVFGWKKEAPENLSTVFVGDRVKLRTIEVRRDSVVLDVVQTGPDDAGCCPTQLARRIYKMQGGKLKETARIVSGPLNQAALIGPSWKLEEINGRPLPAGVQVPTVSFSLDRIHGFGGCHTYSGTAVDTGPGKISFGPLRMTREACPEPMMSLEGSFITAMRKVTWYTFVEGRLALAWIDSADTGSMLFGK